MNWALRLILSVRFQFLGALLFAVLLPALIRSNFSYFRLSLGNTPETMVGTSIAVLLGYFFHRRLRTFPGVKSDYYIIPTFAASYGCVLFAYFLFRLDYTAHDICHQLHLGDRMVPCDRADQSHLPVLPSGGRAGRGTPITCSTSRVSNGSRLTSPIPVEQNGTAWSST